MSVIIRVTLPYPPSANRYWRSAPGRGLVPSKEATEYKRLVAAQASHLVPLYGAVKLELIFHRPQASGDLSNRIKVLEDALNGLAWLDDSQIVEGHHWRYEAHSPKHAHVIVTATAERRATPEEIAEHRAKLESARTKRRATLKRNRSAKLKVTSASYPARKP